MSNKFIVEKIQREIASSLYYEDDQFEIKPPLDLGVSYFTVNTLSVEMDASGRILYIQGYAPLKIWEETSHFPQQYEHARLRFIANEAFEPGVSYEFKSRYQPVYINLTEGWVCIGDPNPEKYLLVHCAPGCVVALKNREFCALWLKPAKLPPLGQPLVSNQEVQDSVEKKEFKDYPRKFEVTKPQEDQYYNLFYDEKNSSFDIDPHFVLDEERKDYDNHKDYLSPDIEPHHGSGFAVLVINHLKLEVEEDGTVLYAWGYCPLEKTLQTTHQPQNVIFKSLKYIFKEPLVKGICYALNDEDWPVYTNPESGWVCIGDPMIEDIQMVEFSPGSIASLKEDKIIALWLKSTKLSCN